jgi:hypothetical protein
VIVSLANYTGVPSAFKRHFQTAIPYCTLFGYHCPMSPRRPSRNSKHHSLKSHCGNCGRPRQPDEVFSNRGMCEDCGLCNMVAWSLGLTHTYYTIEDINTKLVYSYRGPVVKVA